VALTIQEKYESILKVKMKETEIQFALFIVFIAGFAIKSIVLVFALVSATSLPILDKETVRNHIDHSFIFLDH
jgi:hypothetical protein